MEGRLICTEKTGALLVSHLVQGRCLKTSILHSELEGPELEPESNMGLRKMYKCTFFFFLFQRKWVTMMM